MGKLSTFFNNYLNGILFLIVLLVNVACEDHRSNGPEQDYDDFGLSTVVALEIDSSDLSSMRNDAYSKPKVRGTVWLDDEPYSATISYSGATSIDNYKKSFEVVLDNAYNDRRIYRFNAMPTDDSALRALVSYRVFELAGFDMPELKPIALWLNDEYAGLFLWQEKIDAEYFQNRNIVPIALYQAENSQANMRDISKLDEEFSAKIGSKEKTDLKRLISILMEPVGDENLAKLEELLHVEDVLNYMAVIAYINALDGIDNNFYIVRTNEEHRFSILPWDLDRTFHEIIEIDNGMFFKRNMMMSRLFSGCSAYTLKYAQYYRTVVSSANAEKLSLYIDELVELMLPAYQHDKYLSSGPLTLEAHATILKDHLFANEDAFKSNNQ